MAWPKSTFPRVLRPPAVAPASRRLLPAIAGPEVVTPTDPALAAALDRAFVEPSQGRGRRTRAVVIVHDDRIIAERYAPGYGVCAKSSSSIPRASPSS